MKTNVYLDTTIVSALFDNRTPERKKQTEQFWEHINDYTVFISDLVIDEIKGASQPLQDEMLKKVASFVVLPITEDAQFLADMYIKNNIFPNKYLDDALHTAITSINRGSSKTSALELLLTLWRKLLLHNFLHCKELAIFSES